MKVQSLVWVLAQIMLPAMCFAGADRQLFKVDEMAKVERKYKLICGDDQASIPSNGEIKQAIAAAKQDPNSEIELQQMWIQIATHKIMRAYLDKSEADRFGRPIICHNQDEFDELLANAQSAALSKVPKGTAGMMVEKMIKDAQSGGPNSALSSSAHQKFKNAFVLNENLLSAEFDHGNQSESPDTVRINSIVINLDSGVAKTILRLSIKRRDSLYMVDFYGNDKSRQKVQRELTDWRLSSPATRSDTILVTPKAILILVDSTRVRYTPIKTTIREGSGEFYFETIFSASGLKTSPIYSFKFKFDAASMKSLIANLGDDQIRKELRAVNAERNEN